MTPSFKTCRELAWGEVAPKKAEESVNGMTTMFTGTSFKASLPLILRFPSFRSGLVASNMCCLHFWFRVRSNDLWKKKLNLSWLRLLVLRTKGAQKLEVLGSRDETLPAAVVV